MLDQVIVGQSFADWPGYFSFKEADDLTILRLFPFFLKSGFCSRIQRKQLRANTAARPIEWGSGDRTFVVAILD
jgi:hypothetical protein